MHDEMIFLLTKEGSVKVWSDKELGEHTENTVLKVANLMKERYGVDKGIEIKLKKNIPISAGLGGGSSNAATAIKVLDRLWQLNLKEEEKHRIAEEIGSDVNFFLLGGTALGEERGEKVRALEPMNMDMILLIKPDFGISSKEAYQGLSKHAEPGKSLSDAEKQKNSDRLDKLLDSQDPSYCYNGFQFSLVKRYPVLEEIIEYLERNGAVKATISGSGSTIVGFYQDRKRFDDHFNHYTEKGFWCCQTKTKRS